MYVLSAVVVNIGNIGSHNIERETQINAATCIVAFDRLKNLDWLAMSLVFRIEYLFYRRVYGLSIIELMVPELCQCVEILHW